ncbi:MAG: flagellar biosynthetic protein FliO [Rhizobacter sp.]|nr:flagellar biosynthetic protein FliO [Bacteriovorax sp.]
MKTLALLLISLASLNLSAADVTIKSAELVNARGSEARLLISHTGTLNDNPRIIVKDKMLNISIPNSGLAGKINKKVNGSSVSATMSGEETVSVNVALPYSLQGREAEVTITLKEGVIDVHYPRIETAKKAVTAENSRSPGITDKAIVLETPEAVAAADKLDENYLSTLTKNQEKLAAANHPKASIEANKASQLDTDRVNLAQSGIAKPAATSQTTGEQATTATQSKFSVAGYIGKFVAFMAIMIAGFYGVLTLFKKGIIKKGKLGFLNSTKLVEVLSTTHIAPKKSLIMIKAHKQVFLISNTEAGMTLVSEIKDVAGLIKTGEEEVTGSNFDTNLYTANKTDKSFRLKEESTVGKYSDLQDDDYEMDSLDDMLNDSVPAAKTENNYKKSNNVANAYGQTNASKAIDKAPVQDQVRFSDQIKSKVKGLKQL